MNTYAFCNYSSLRLHHPRRQQQCRRLQPAVVCTSANPSPTTPDWFEDALKLDGGTTAPNSHCQFTKRKPAPPFFEGWYFRLTLPSSSSASSSSFSLIFALEAPNIGTIQIIDNEDKLHILQLPTESTRFHSNSTSWSFSHWSRVDKSKTHKHITCYENRYALHGWTVTPTGMHGIIHSSNTNCLIEWCFEYGGSLSWGSRGNKRSRHTGTWVAKYPLFEPGYQILMAHGRITSGNISIKHYGSSNEVKDIDVKGATVYCEKNWGVKFPRKWFWIQCNTFNNDIDMCMVGVGAIRKIIMFEETIGMVSIIYNGEMYEFSNWSSTSLTWNVKWGHWHAQAESFNGFSVCVDACVGKDDCGVAVLGPSGQGGMEFMMRDSMSGIVKVVLKNGRGDVIVEAKAENAQVEVGGEGWDGSEDEEWIGDVKALRQPIRGLINFFNGGNVKTIHS